MSVRSGSNEPYSCTGSRVNALAYPVKGSVDSARLVIIEGNVVVIPADECLFGPMLALKQRPHLDHSGAGDRVRRLASRFLSDVLEELMEMWGGCESEFS